MNNWFKYIVWIDSNSPDIKTIVDRLYKEQKDFAIIFKDDDSIYPAHPSGVVFLYLKEQCDWLKYEQSRRY